MITGFVFGLLLRVSGMAPARIAAPTVPGLVSDVVTAGVDVSATLAEMDLVATFAVCESAGRRDAIGDGGAAVGSTQLHEEHWRGYGRDEVLASRVLQIELWILSLRDAVAACGSVERGLGRIAAGKCGGAPKLVRRRMRGKC